MIRRISEWSDRHPVLGILLVVAIPVAVDGVGVILTIARGWPA